MPGIFVSYRRSGTSTTTYRLVDDLRRAFGPEHIFLDVESIDPGIPFAEAIKLSLAKSSVALIMIGPEWATVKDDAGEPRLQNHDDWVRQEVRAALAANSRVIPVLVQGAEMPLASQLPEDMRGLTELNAFTLLPSQTHWSFDVNRLIENIKRADPNLAKTDVPPTPRPNPAPPAPAPKHYSYKVIGGLALLVLVLLASTEGWDDAGEILFECLILVVGAGLCIAGLIDINKGKTTGFKGAITGISINSIAAVCYLIGSLIFSMSGGYDTYNELDYSNNSSQLLQNQTINTGNLNGTWVSPTSTIQVTHNGNNFSFIDINAFGAQVGSGQGNIQNGSLQFQYYNSLFDSSFNGTGTANNGALYFELYEPNSGQRIPITYYRQ
ncbi:toll/interleukin-1 receptor domain-containing protein [Aurantivibrio infirmus]